MLESLETRSPFFFFPASPSSWIRLFLKFFCILCRLDSSLLESVAVPEKAPLSYLRPNRSNGLSSPPQIQQPPFVVRFDLMGGNLMRTTPPLKVPSSLHEIPFFSPKKIAFFYYSERDIGLQIYAKVKERREVMLM